MSDYTPTTGEVRAVWTTWNGYGGLINRTGPEPETSEATAVEFDRFLAAHDEQVRADERQHIARAIRRHDLPTDGGCIDMRDDEAHTWRCGYRHAIVDADRIARTGGDL